MTVGGDKTSEDEFDYVDGLDAQDLEEARAILAFERKWLHREGCKAASIRDVFGWDERYHEGRVNLLLDQPGPEIIDPQTVKRLRRLRDQRRNARCDRR